MKKAANEGRPFRKLLAALAAAAASTIEHGSAEKRIKQAKYRAGGNTCLALTLDEC